MPSSITHAYFANDLLNDLKIGNDKIDSKKVNYFAQCTDPFHFYRVLMPWKRNRKKIQLFTHTFHSSNCGNFLALLTQKIKEQNLQSNKEIVSFLYGFTAHYILDSTMHPYIIYHSGIFIPKQKQTHKYNSIHNEMEMYLDHYLYEKREQAKFKNYKSHKELFQLTPLSKECQVLLDDTIAQIYHFENFSKYYYQSLKDMRFVFHYLRYDPYGILEKAYIVFDKVMPSSVLNAKFLSFHYIPENAYQYLNNNHQMWAYPWKPSKKSHQSFDELYETARKKGNQVLKEIDNYLFRNKNVDLPKLFGNLSCTTGLNDSIKYENPKYKF